MKIPFVCWLRAKYFGEYFRLREIGLSEGILNGGQTGDDGSKKEGGGGKALCRGTRLTSSPLSLHDFALSILVSRFQLQCVAGWHVGSCAAVGVRVHSACWSL
jgi:hypothetical protein